MGRPPCCDKVGIKKGPWTPEEDIILVSYIQEHGPGNWRAVPTNTGLLRCSKSCRLRWTNYLRPGIKRGNFTQHEEGMIVHLQALLGNKWAAIASYLPQRTDNDIKNYWNTHLKKKLKKFESGYDPKMAPDSKFMTGERGTNNRRYQSPGESSSVYASSAENISRLLEGWMRSSSPTNDHQNNTTVSNLNNSFGIEKLSNDAFGYRPVQETEQSEGMMITSPTDHELEYIMNFKNNNLSCDSIGSNDVHQKVEFVNDAPPLSFLEKWLLDESANQVELPSIF